MSEGAIAAGLGEQRVDHADDRRVVLEYSGRYLQMRGQVAASAREAGRGALSTSSTTAAAGPLLLRVARRDAPRHELGRPASCGVDDQPVQAGRAVEFGQRRQRGALADRDLDRVAETTGRRQLMRCERRLPSGTYREPGRAAAIGRSRRLVRSRRPGRPVTLAACVGEGYPSRAPGPRPIVYSAERARSPGPARERDGLRRPARRRAASRPACSRARPSGRLAACRDCIWRM
jgi:hypothetical protein